MIGSETAHGLPGDVNGIGSDHSVQSYQATSFGKPIVAKLLLLIYLSMHASLGHITLYYHRGLIRGFNIIGLPVYILYAHAISASDFTYPRRETPVNIVISGRCY